MAHWVVHQVVPVCAPDSVPLVRVVSGPTVATALSAVRGRCGRSSWRRAREVCPLAGHQGFMMSSPPDWLAHDYLAHEVQAAGERPILIIRTVQVHD